MLTVTFSAARRHVPCAEGYDQWGLDRPFPLVEVLDTSGLNAALCALRIAQPAAEWDRIARLLAADYAERVLPIFEAAMPGDRRLRDAIAVVRRYARGEATIQEMSDSSYSAAHAARDARDAAMYGGADGNAVYAAKAAAWAASYDIRHSDAAMHATRDACTHIIVTSDADTHAKAASWVAERQWQAARLRQYLTGEVNPCK